MSHADLEKNNLTIVMDYQTALKKAEHFCAYQERSRQEVKDKLFDLGVVGDEAGRIIEHLDENNFINEERFVKAYSLGKFRMKSWGKVRIRQGLMRKGIAENLIELGLHEIDSEGYKEKLKQMIERKSEVEDDPNPYQKNHNVAKYLISHGYEPELVWEELQHAEK